MLIFINTEAIRTWKYCMYKKNNMNNTNISIYFMSRTSSSDHFQRDDMIYVVLNTSRYIYFIIFLSTEGSS